MDLFKVSPESKVIFDFLKLYHTEDGKFYDLVSKHSMRVLGMVSNLVKEASDLPNNYVTGRKKCLSVSFEFN